MPGGPRQAAPWPGRCPRLPGQGGPRGPGYPPARAFPAIKRLKVVERTHHHRITFVATWA